MQKALKQLAKRLETESLRDDEPLAPHTYMKVGGPADLFLIARTKEELRRAVREAILLGVPYFILGGGSNILISDRGIRGLTIKNRTSNLTIQRFKGKVKAKSLAIQEARVEAESGVPTNLLVRTTVQHGLSGLEYFLGVPGTVGGAIFNNSHFKDELIGNAVASVKVIDRAGNEKTYTQEELQFGYDTSILQKTQETVLSATFLLTGVDPNRIWKKAEDFARYRAETQPLNLPSSGCIFKNVNAREGTYGQTRGGLTSAGYLIDKAGLKGTKVGGAMVSEKHASFIVNVGGATAADIYRLIGVVRDRVLEQFGVKLELEIFLVGEFQ